MSEHSRKITIELELPTGIALQAEAIHAIDPTFLARIVQYGITRREIYRRMEQLGAEAARTRRRESLAARSYPGMGPPG